MNIKITRPATTLIVDGEEKTTGALIEGDESLLWLGERVDSNHSATEEEESTEEALSEYAEEAE